MKIYSFAGWSKSGKTTLITKLIEHFSQKNKQVIAVKHVPHKYYLEPESTDSHRFLQAGAREACLISKNEILQMRLIPGNTGVIPLLVSQYAHCDFLLLEGLRQDNIPLIEVFDSSRDHSLKCPIESLCAVVSDIPITGAVPNFNPQNIDEIATFMEVYHG